MSFLHSVGVLAEKTAMSLSSTALFCTGAAADVDVVLIGSGEAACARQLTLCSTCDCTRNLPEGA